MHIVAFRICLLQIINQLGSPRSPDPDHVVPYIWQNLAPVRKMQTLHKSQTTKHKLLSRHKRIREIKCSDKKVKRDLNHQSTFALRITLHSFQEISSKYDS